MQYKQKKTHLKPRLRPVSHYKTFRGLFT